MARRHPIPVPLAAPDDELGGRKIDVLHATCEGRATPAGKRNARWSNKLDARRSVSYSVRPYPPPARIRAAMG